MYFKYRITYLVKDSSDKDVKQGKTGIIWAVDKSLATKIVKHRYINRNVTTIRIRPYNKHGDS